MGEVRESVAMLQLRTICGFVASAGFHGLLIGALAWGTFGPPPEAEAPMLVVSQWASQEGVETAELEVPAPARSDCEFPVVAPPTAEPMVVAAGEMSRLLSGDLPEPSENVALGFGVPGGLLSGGGGSGGGLEGGATFFGTTAPGTRFVYVVDASRSMAGTRFRKAKRELFRSVSNLREDQQYYVIFFGLDAYPMYFPQPWPEPVASVPQTWRRLHRWMGYVDPQTQPATNGKSAMMLALALEPDAIYLLSDGAFTDDTVAALLAMDRNEIPIHTIAFGTENARADLERIADEHQGAYRFVR
jgi:hypothetical protein